MSRLPPIKSLQVEDFTEQKSWIGKLLYPLNQFMQTVYENLNNNLELGINVRAQVYQFRFIEGTTDLPLRYISTIGRPQAIFVGNVIDISDSPSPLVDAPFVVWDFVSGQVRVNQILGLVSTKEYRITLVSF